jgi:putative hydrolase of the HAD superfamily
MSLDSLFTERIQTLSRPLQPLPTGQEERLTDLPGIRAVIFDIYGTCFISGSGDIGNASASPKTEALTDALREQGVEMDHDLAEPAMARFFELIAHDHQVEKSKGTEYPEVRILDIWEHWRREAAVEVNVPQLAIDVECRLNPVWPMPGLAGCLDGVTGSGRIPGIVSNAQVFTPCLFPALAGRPIAEFGFQPSCCIWSWSLKEAKPSRRLYDLLLERLPDGLEASQCLYVGNDMRNDIAPAAAVGMKTALFAGDRRSLRLREGDPLTEGVSPDLVVTHLHQILECLG